MSRLGFALTGLACVAGLAGVATARVNAQSCTDQYGGTVACQPVDLTINKEVQNPQTGAFVENITTPLFSSGNIVVFKLTVTNASGETFRPVTVTDSVPENFRIDDTQVATTDPATVSVAMDKKSVTITLNSLPASQSVDLFLWTHLVGPYPTTDSFCRTNTTRATAPARPKGDDDTATVCVQTKVMAATTLPVAGYNDLVLVLPFMGVGLGGLALLKKRG